MKKRTMRNMLFAAVVMLYLVCAVFATTACSGHGAASGAASDEQVQITWGANNSNKVSFATLYDALAWLNSCEYNGGTATNATARGNNGYLKDWATAHSMPDLVEESGGRSFAAGKFTVTVLTQNGVENAPRCGVPSVDSNDLPTYYDAILALDNPYADVTLASAGNFNLNLNPRNHAALNTLDVGFAKFTLGSMTLASNHTIYMHGHDITVDPSFKNTGAESIYAGTESGECTVPDGVGNTTLNDGVCTMDINSSGARLGTVSGGNNTGTYHGKTALTISQAAKITYVLGGGGAYSNSATATYDSTDSMVINVKGGDIVHFAGMGYNCNYLPDGITINMDGGRVTNMAGGGFGAVKTTSNTDITMNITGGEITTNLYGTQWGANSASTYGHIKMNIIPAAGKMLLLPTTVAGNNNAACSDVVMDVDSTAAPGTNFSRVNNWYVGNSSAVTGAQANTLPFDATLTLNTPGATFNNVYGSGSMSSGNPNNNKIVINVLQAKSFRNLYAFNKLQGFVEAKGIIRLGGDENGAYDDGTNPMQLNISNDVMGFSELHLYSAKVAVNGLIRPEASPGINADYTNYWMYGKRSGNIYLNGGSELNTPKKAQSVVVYDILSEDDDPQNTIFGYAGTGATGAPGILVLHEFEGNIRVGANTNAPTVVYDGSNVTALRTIIKHFTQPNRDLSVTIPPTASEAYRAYWNGQNGVTGLDNGYTYLGLLTDTPIRVSDTNTGGSIKNHKTLTAALQDIASRDKGDYTVTFLIDYDATAEFACYNAADRYEYTNADVITATNTIADTGSVITYSGYWGPSINDATPTKVLSDQNAPAGSSTVTVPRIFSWHTATNLENLVVRTATASNNDFWIMANGFTSVVKGGVEYLNSDYSTCYARIYGTRYGTPFSNDGMMSTDLTLYSGTYTQAVGGYYFAPPQALNFDSRYPTVGDGGKTYKLTIYGGDYTGGVATVTKNIETSDGNTQAISYPAYNNNNATGYVSASYVSSRVNTASGANTLDNIIIDFKSADLVIEDRNIGDSDQVYTLKAPGQIVGLLGSRVQYTNSLQISAAPSITIDTDQALSFGAVAGASTLTPIAEYNYATRASALASDNAKLIHKVSINAPNSTFDIVMGQGRVNPQYLYRTNVTLGDVKYIHALDVGAVASKSKTSTPLDIQVTNGEDYAVLNVNGEVNVSSVGVFSNAIVNGQDAKLNVVSTVSEDGTANANSAVAYGGNSTNAPNVLSAGAGYASVTGTKGGNLTIKDGGTVNLYAETQTAQAVSNLIIEGNGNTLNTYGNTLEYSATGANLGVLNVWTGCEIRDDASLTLGLTSNTDVDVGAATGDRVANIIRVTGSANLRADVGGAGAYWDFNQLNGTGKAYHFVSDTNSMVVRSDAFKNYTTIINGIILDNDDKDTGSANGFMYLSRKTTTTDIDLIMVSPSPRDGGNAYEFYGTLADAANSIAGASTTNSAYTITFLCGQPYEVTSADAAAVKSITSSKATDLIFSGNYGEMPGDYSAIKDSNVYRAPAQKSAALDMGNSDFTFDASIASVTFRDMYSLNHPLSFAGGSQVTIEDTVHSGITKKASGALISGIDDPASCYVPSGATKTIDNTDGNTYNRVTGQNAAQYKDGMVAGDGATFFVDQDGFIWRATTQSDADLNDSYDLAGGKFEKSKYRIDTIDGKPYTKTKEVYVVDEDSTTLTLGNVNGITGIFTVDGTRNVTISKGFNSPQGTVEVPAIISLTPSEAGLGRYTYDVNQLDANAIIIAKGKQYGTGGVKSYPLNIRKALGKTTVSLGLECYGIAIPEKNDTLLTSPTNGENDLSTYTYQEQGNLLNGLAIDKAENIVKLAVSPGAYAQDFMIQADKVYKPSTTDYNMPVIADPTHANLKYNNADGTNLYIKDAPVSVDVGIKDNALKNEPKEEPYDVTFVFTGDGVSTDPAVPSTATVKATVRDNVIIDPDNCKLGGNNFDIELSTLIKTNTEDIANGNTEKLDELVKTAAQVVGKDKFGAELKLSSVSYGTVQDNTALNEITSNADYAGKTCDVTFTYHCDAGEEHTLLVTATITDTSIKGIDVDGDGIPDINVDTDKDGKPDTNLDPTIKTEADLGEPTGTNPDTGKPVYQNYITAAKNDPAHKGPQLNVDTNDTGVWQPSSGYAKDDTDDGVWSPDKNIDTDGDGKVEIPQIDRDAYPIDDAFDADGKPTADSDGVDDYWKPDTPMQSDSGYPDDETGDPTLNRDTDGDGIPDTNVDVNGDGIPDVNVDTDKDGMPDINLDPNLKDDLGEPTGTNPKTGKPVYQDYIDAATADPNDDKGPQLNEDTNGTGAWQPSGATGDDGIWSPDKNIDTNGDGEPEKLKDATKADIDKFRDTYPIDDAFDEDDKPTADSDGVDDYWKPATPIDATGYKPDEISKKGAETGDPTLNRDTDGDGIPDTNVDVNGDGIPDVNVDTDKDGKADINLDPNLKNDLGEPTGTNPATGLPVYQDYIDAATEDPDDDKGPQLNEDTNDTGAWQPSSGPVEIWSPDKNLDIKGNGTVDIPTLDRGQYPSADTNDDGVDDYWKPDTPINATGYKPNEISKDGAETGDPTTGRGAASMIIVANTNSGGFDASELVSTHGAGDVALGKWQDDTAFTYTLYLKVGTRAGVEADNAKIAATAELYRENESNWGASKTAADYLGDYTLSFGTWTKEATGPYAGYGKTTLTIQTGDVCKSSVVLFTPTYDGETVDVKPMVGVVPGDVNQNGTIRLNDASNIMAYLDDVSVEDAPALGWKYFQKLADANGNGAIRLNDAAVIMAMIDDDTVESN